MEIVLSLKESGIKGWAALYIFLDVKVGEKAINISILYSIL